MKTIPKLDRFESMVEIKWVDSCHDSGWTRLDKLDLDDKYLFHKTVGYYLSRTKNAISVVQSCRTTGDEGRSIDAIMTIPLVAISAIKVLT